MLNKDKIDSFLAGPNRKKGDLRQAYEIARDPTSWNEEQNTIVRNYEKSLQDAAEEEEENQDQLEEDEEDEGAPSKKRKREPESGKVRESADKRKKSKAAEAAKTKVCCDGGNSRTAVCGLVTLTIDTDSVCVPPCSFPLSRQVEKPTSKGAAATNGDDKSEESLDPETKKVKDWRHKVQKVFLTKDGTINAEEMPQADSTFKVIEEYDAMTADALRTTKIGKVMKRVMQLSQIPRDDEYHFKDRAEKLCARWGAIMAGDAPKDAANEEPAKENGDASAHVDAEPKSEAEAPAADAESS